MLQTRVIPCLLIEEDALVKTVKFKNPVYVGDPVNAIKIYNEKEVDELIILDISVTKNKGKINFQLISEIVDECFMPLAYGGGVRNLDDMKKIYNLGVEKIAINSYAFEDPDFIKKAADKFGSQSVVVSIDVKKNFWGKYEVYGWGGEKSSKADPVTWAQQMEAMGAGELMLTSIDRDGTWEGYDLELIKKVTSAVDIPVIASGGAGKIEHFSEAVKIGGASAVATGSMVVFQKKNLGVLINFPQRKDLDRVLA